jgi:hypothetical protein
MRALTTLVDSSTPVAPVLSVRTLVGVAAFVDGLITWGTLTRLLEPGILQLPILPVPRLSPAWVTPLMCAWLISAAAFTCGWPRRVAGIALSCVLGYVLVLDEQTYSNHLYLLALIVLLLTVALWQPRAGRAPSWAVFLLKAQLTIAYAFAAATKLNPAFLSGAVIYANLRRPLLDVGPPLISFPVLATVAWISVATEFFLSWALWTRRWRAPGIVVGLAFHTSLVVLMGDPTRFGLMVFAVCCWSLYLLFPDVSDPFARVAEWAKTPRTNARSRPQSPTASLGLRDTAPARGARSLDV